MRFPAAPRRAFAWRRAQGRASSSSWNGAFGLTCRARSSYFCYIILLIAQCFTWYNL
jgi:hypothetical protein